MLIYMNFLLKTFSKKFGPYILMLIHIAIFGFILKSTIDNGIPGQTLLSVNTFDKFFPFLFASLFSIMVAIHVIKEGESNGIDLMIVAKPITRPIIIMSKFLVIFILLVVYQILTFFCYFALAMYDTAASNLVRLRWAVSFSLGGLIVQSIFIFVIIIIASTLGKMSTSVIALLSAAIIPIFSFMIVQLGRGYVRLNDATSGRQSILQTFKWKKEKGSSTNKTLSISKVYKYGLENSKYAKDRWDNYLKQRWYEYAFPFDVWYQWARFYSLFIEDRSPLISSEMSSSAFPFKGSVQKLTKEEEIKIQKEEEIKSKGHDLVLKIGKGDNKKEYHLYFKHHLKDWHLTKQIQSFFQKPKLVSFINILVAKFKKEFQVGSDDKKIESEADWRKSKITLDNFNKLNLSNRLSWIDIKLDYLISQFGITNILENLVKNKSVFKKLLKLSKSTIYVILSNELELTDPLDSNNKLRIDNENVEIPNPEVFSFAENNFVRSDNNTPIGWKITSKSYLNTTIVILVWVFIALILGSISIAIFFKKDFK